MIRRLLLTLSGVVFLVWLFWPRVWMPQWLQVVFSWTPSGLGSSLNAARSGHPADGAAPEALAPTEDRSPDQVAIFPFDASQETLPAELAWRAAGVPYTVVRTTGAAYAHSVVFVPGSDKPMRMKRADLDVLSQFVSMGGTLIVQATALAPWPEITGVGAVVPRRSRKAIALRAGADEGFSGFERAEELLVPLASRGAAEGPWTAGLLLRHGRAEVLATFPATKETAMSRRLLGTGRVYVVGADLRDLVVRPRAGRAFDAARAGSNVYEPAADVWPRLLAAWYAARVPDSVRLRSLPGEAKGLLLLSHSIESGVALGAARDWAVWESSRGLASTWFVQTNHSDGGQSGPFYDSGLAAQLREISSLGHELAAHTVVHAAAFERLPLGTGLEKRKDYRPETEAGQIWDATKYGEIRVPKEILEADVPGAKVSGFRAPDTAFPDDLDTDLAASGYRYDSSRTAADALTHHPFLMTRGRGMSAESRIVELPMTIEDELPRRGEPLTAGDVLRLIRAVFSDEGVVVWQSRPSNDGLRRLSEVIAGLPSDTRVLPLGAAARWWTARERTRFWLEPGDGEHRRILRLSLPPEADGADLSFEAARVVSDCAALTPGVEVLCAGRLIRLTRTGGIRDATVSFGLVPPVR